MESLTFKPGLRKRFRRMFNIAIAMSFTVLIPAVSLLYGILNKPNGRIHSLETTVDRETPFVKEFIIFYVSWYVFIYITLFILCIKNRRIYYITLISYITGLLVCFGIFFTFQTTVLRPEVYGNDFFTGLLRLIYHNDKPYNCFPSIHVMTSFLLARAVGKSFLKNRIVTYGVYLWAVLIILSTLFIKQHVLLDVVSGIFLAVSIFNITMYFAERFFLNGKKVLLPVE